MDREKRAQLEAEGWRFGDAADFVGLSAEESLYVELRLSLSKGIREFRQRRRLTQAQLAELMGSSQSRVAKAETADSSVSLDLQIRSLLAMGASRQDLARLISSPE